MLQVADVFQLLADTSRRRLYERLALQGEMSVSALTEGSGISQPAVSQHLSALKSGRLVQSRQFGRSSFYSVTNHGLDPVANWMEQYGAFWRGRFDQLEILLEEMKE